MANIMSLKRWRWVFAAAALWTTLGAVPGFLDTANTFVRFHGAPPDSALMLQIYRGAWGQSFLFALGYLLAAFAPIRYAAIVALGMVGKAFYAVGLGKSILAGAAGPLAAFAMVGDLVFVGLFLVFLLTSGVLRTMPLEMDSRAGLQRGA